jgi:hypothetical protein
MKKQSEAQKTIFKALQQLQRLINLTKDKATYLAHIPQRTKPRSQPMWLKGDRAPR